MDRLARAMRKHKLVRSPVTNKAVETQQAPEVPVVERSQKEGESMSSAA
jgi:hypothetical protein